jgi:hypothetical protein
MSDDGVRVINDGEEEEIGSTSAEETPNLATPIPHGMIRQFHEQDVRRSQHTMQVGGQQQTQLVEAEFLEGELARWYGRCWICHEQGWDEWHGLEDCRRRESEKAQQWARQVQQQLRYERYSGCWGCGLPQAICEQWVSNGQGRWVQDPSRECQYPKGTVIGMVAGMLHGQDGEIWAAWMQWLQQHEVDGQQLDEVIRFLGRRRRGGMEPNYLVVAFCWLRHLYG